MNTANDGPAIEHGATVYDGDEVTLTDAPVRHVLRTSETGSSFVETGPDTVNGRLVVATADRGRLGARMPLVTETPAMPVEGFEPLQEGRWREPPVSAPLSYTARPGAARRPARAAAAASGGGCTTASGRSRPVSGVRPCRGPLAYRASESAPPPSPLRGALPSWRPSCPTPPVPPHIGARP